MDTILFLEIILSEGAVEMNLKEQDGIVSAVYLGPSKRPVFICISDEDIHPEAVKGYLKQLGLESLINRLSL